MLRFGHAVAVDEGRAAGVRALDRDVAQWDVLCTGGPAGTAWMREATGFAGEVREVGHPALDAYRASDLAARAADVRRRSGIGDGPVLLTRRRPGTPCGPTPAARRSTSWSRDAAGGGPRADRAAARPPEHRQPAALSPTSGVVDVTLYPELSDLVLAADAVVSDYSTLCVDVLASPTPLAPVRARTGPTSRSSGFFPDLFGSPPGPVAESTEELVPWLVDGLGTVHPGRGLLAGQLLPLDDGHAAQRLVDAEWG